MIEEVQQWLFHTGGNAGNLVVVHSVRLISSAILNKGEILKELPLLSEVTFQIHSINNNMVLAPKQTCRPIEQN